MKVYFPKMKKVKNPKKHSVDRSSIKKTYKLAKRQAKMNNLKKPTMAEIERMLKEENEVEVYSNGIAECHVNMPKKDENGNPTSPIHLSIKNYERSIFLSWQMKQWIKNDIVGEEVEAVELFPAESRLVNGANQYHLWCFDKGVMRFGFPARMVSSEKPEGNGQQDLPIRVFSYDNERAETLI